MDLTEWSGLGKCEDTPTQREQKNPFTIPSAHQSGSFLTLMFCSASGSVVQCLVVGMTGDDETSVCLAPALSALRMRNTFQPHPRVGVV